MSRVQTSVSDDEHSTLPEFATHSIPRVTTYPTLHPSLVVVFRHGTLRRDGKDQLIAVEDAHPGILSVSAT